VRAAMRIEASASSSHVLAWTAQIDTPSGTNKEIYLGKSPYIYRMMERSAHSTQNMSFRNYKCKRRPSHENGAEPNLDSQIPAIAWNSART
jgi:hypothetical protein